jgi:hypothetical protein
MGDNRKRYGFRWSEDANGGPAPKPITGYLASAYQGAINGGSNIDVNVGDPVGRLSTGYWEVRDGSEGGSGGETVEGIVVGIGGHYDSTEGYFRYAERIPGGTTYTGIEENGSKLFIVPAHLGLWEVDCDDKATATTYAAYHALIGENCDHVLTTGSEPKADPMLDISGHGTSSAQWRIHAISKTVDNRDFAGLYVKLIVAPNEIAAPMLSSGNTGV